MVWFPEMVEVMVWFPLVMVVVMGGGVMVALHLYVSETAI